jgi:hypothetical protein
MCTKTTHTWGVVAYSSLHVIQTEFFHFSQWKLPSYTYIMPPKILQFPIQVRQILPAATCQAVHICISTYATVRKLMVARIVRQNRSSATISRYNTVSLESGMELCCQCTMRHLLYYPHAINIPLLLASLQSDTTHVSPQTVNLMASAVIPKPPLPRNWNYLSQSICKKFFPKQQKLLTQASALIPPPLPRTNASPDCQKCKSKYMTNKLAAWQCGHQPKLGPLGES